MANDRWEIVIVYDPDFNPHMDLQASSLTSAGSDIEAHRDLGYCSKSSVWAGEEGLGLQAYDQELR